MADLVEHFKKFVYSLNNNKLDAPKTSVNSSMVSTLRSICSEVPQLMHGITREEGAAIWQWVEYYQIHIGEDLKQASTVLQDLNHWLANSAFLVGNYFTGADYVIYHGLHSTIAKLNGEDKERVVNVCRWFDLVQHHPFVRQHRALVKFSKTPLYKISEYK